MKLNLVCPHCSSEIPFKKPFIFTDCPKCGEKLTITKQEVEKTGCDKKQFAKNKIN